MEAQMEHPQRSVIGEEEHHEKKSMMKKMKDKAVKIKDTLKRYGHGHDHDHVNEGENDEEEEEEEEEEEDADDDEGVQNPKVHGTAVFESTTAHILEGQGGHPGGSSVHLGNPPSHQEDSNKSGASEASPANYQAKPTDPSFTGGAEAHVNPITHSFQEMKFSEEPEKTIAQTLEGQEEHLGRSGVHLGNPQPLQEDPNQLSAVVASSANYQAKTTAPSSTELVFESTTAHTLEEQGGHPGRSGVHLGNPQPHQEDSNKSSASEASPPKYQAKTIDPLSTGGAEAHAGHVTHSFQEMKFSEEPEKTTAQILEGQGEHLGRSGVHLSNPQPLQEDPNQLSAVVDSPPNYQAKTTSPLSTGGLEAPVSPVTHSFQEMKVFEELEKTTAQTLEGQGGHLGRSEVHSGNPQPLQEDPNQPGVGVALLANYQAKTTDPSSTGEAEAHVSPQSFQEMKVYEEPEKTEESPRGSHDQFSPSEPTPTQEKPEPSAASTVSEVVTGKTAQGPEEKGVSVKDYLVGKLSPGEEDKALSEVISEAMQRREEGEPLVVTEGVVETENGVVRKEEGVVGKIMGAVTSLFKKDESGQQGQGEIHHEDTEGRRLQESGN